VKSIKAPTLIINGNNDVGSVEHAVEMYRTIAGSQLAILPGKHGTYIGAVEYLDNGKWTQHYIVDLINDFLNEHTILSTNQ
jgi:pimeloyl-ACP methyl ester carboxylesterase